MTGSIENLDLFLDKICKIVNIKRPETIHTNKSNHADWKEYYKNPEVIKIVNDIYREDFIKFNYTTLL
jgi:hypothetical protein